MGSDTQRDALEAAFRIGTRVAAAADDNLYKVWSRMLSSDHFHYMSTKWIADGEAHKTFSPYTTPYDAYINYMNVLADFNLRVDSALSKKPLTPKKKTVDTDDSPIETKGTTKKTVKKSTKSKSEESATKSV
jgi:alpha-amylase